MRITKKREAALNIALSLDDVLYEKFRRLNEGLHREAARLFRHRRNVEVVQMVDGNPKVLKRLSVEDVQIGPEFMRVIVR